MERAGPSPMCDREKFERYLESEKSQSQTWPLSPEFQCQEDKSPQLLEAKKTQGLSPWKKLLEPQAVPLKEPLPPQSWQAGAISKTPTTWITLSNPP